MSENTTQNMDVAAKNAGTEEVAGTAIAKAAETAVAEVKPNGAAYITTLLNNTFEEFQKANDGLDLDFVYMGSWLTVDKKGDFVDKDDDSIKYKDHIDVIIGKGEKRWSLWGLQNSPEDGQLIVACREKEDAVQQLTAWLQENPEAAERYSVEYTEPLKAVDLVVYTVKRMLRLPYSRHQKTGLYKIELTLQQLKELTYKLKDITDDVIQKYLNDQHEHGNLKLEINDDTGEAAPSHGPVAASSLIQQRRLIIAALEYAVDKGRINRNPGKKTRRPKSKPKTNNILTDEDMETLGIKGTKYRYYPAYMLTLTTACRRGEILGLDWQHVDIGIPWTTVDRYFPWGDIKKLPKWDTKALKTLLEDHNITLGDGYLRLVYQMVDDNGTPFRDELKTDLSRRSLMITEEMVLLLIFWRLIQNTEKRKAAERGIEYNPDNLVFCTRKGTYIYPRNFTKMWSENLRSMGIDHKRFHDLRHTVATVMLEDGEAMNTVQEQLGHYDAGFTASRYGHVTAKMRNSAAVKLGERLEKVRNPEAEDEEDANSVKKEDTVIPFQEGRKLKSAACKIK